MQSVFEEAMARVNIFGDRVRVMRSLSKHAALEVPDESLDVVYIDGDHTCRGIVTDLVAWWPKIRPGGVLGGDDFVEDILQHGASYDPTMVRPAVLGFADATKNVTLFHNASQFAIVKPRS